jgi:putative ABC transport system permease protein
MANLLQDLRYAARAFRRSPGFMVLAVLTIAVGIGANAAIFSVVNAVLLRPLSYPRAHELVLVAQGNRVLKQSGYDATPANFLDWRERNRSFTGLAGFIEGRPTVVFGDTPERTAGAIVTANFFQVLEASPLLGRTFQPADEQPGAPRVAVISHKLWRDRLGAIPGIVGTTLRVNNEPHTIVGVMPADVDYPAKALLWISSHWRVPDDPLSPGEDPSGQRSHGYFSAIGRLKPDVSFEAAVADMDAVALGLERDYPNANGNLGSFVTRLRDDLVADVRSTTLLLFAAVGLLLLIAAANVSGLLMARAAAREQEISVRVALGATRGRILTQLLTESVVLALAGGAAGVLLAMWLINPLVALSPTDLTIAGDVRIDRTVLLFCLGISTGIGILFGMAPARQLSRLDVNDDLKSSARGAIGVRQKRLRAVLVAGEIALSLVLLVAAGLTVRSFVRVQQVPTGFNAEHVLTVTVSPPANRYASQALRADYWEHVLAALQRLPGIDAVGAISRLPLLPGNSTRSITQPDRPPAEQTSGAHYRTASPDYFKVMGIPLLRGRAFDAADREDRPHVAILSSAAAQRFWPGRDPIGLTFKIDVPGPDFTVVGVAGDVRSMTLESSPPVTVYVPYRQDAFPFMTFVMKTSAPAAALVAPVRAAVWQVDKDTPVNGLRTMDEQLSNSLTRRRFSVTLLVAFGITAVALAAIGLYGVLAFIVSQRRREIGVRIALGASARDVITDVLGQGLRLATLGLTIGVGLALGATRLMAALLFGTSPTDVATYAGAAALLAIIAIAASLIPAIRASRVDPLIALRDE